ncbi:MAG: hypothetical protein KTR25_01910 [Myxococcales bacterium]|nr:hypothetical protein [Myxococcales bacterium]
MGWVIREGSFPCNAPDEEGAYRAWATDERRSRSGRSTEKRPAKRLTHFSDRLLGPRADGFYKKTEITTPILSPKNSVYFTYS